MWFFMWPLLIVPLVLLFAFRHNDGVACGHHGYAYLPAQPQRNDALEIARTRLARGEITTEEFETIRRVLG
jgi:uncharacterized membrane protein